MPKEISNFPNWQILSRILDAASEGLVIVNERNRIVYVNKSTVRMFGWEVNELTNQPLDILLPKEIRGKHQHFIKDFARLGPSSRYMGERQAISGFRKNGHTFPAEVSIVSENIDGEMFFAAIIRDVSKRRAREIALLRSESRLRQSQKIANMGSWDLDLKTGELFWSEEAYRIFGIEPKPNTVELSYDTFLDYVHPDDRGFVKSAVQDALDTGKEYSIEHRIVRVDGEVRHVHEQAITTFSDTGEALTMEGVVNDITDRKSNETELINARNAALAASATKTRFLASMSHELRTPLNAIIGFSQMMAQETFGPVGKPIYADYARDISSSGEHLLAIIDTILDTAQIETGTFALKEEVFALLPLVADTIRLLNLGHPSNVGRIVFPHLPKDVTLRADPRLCRQVIFNLCSNALKYSPVDSDITVNINRDDDTNGLIIEIMDQGPGIELKDIERALDAFVQLDNSGHANRQGGIGLGLYLVRNFMEAHGGHIALKSAPGEGTRAQAIFPADRVKHFK